MKVTRKQKLKQRAAKQERTEGRRRATYDRLLNVMGLRYLFAELPQPIRDLFQDRLLPGLEVVAAEDSRHEPDIHAVVRDLQRMIRQPVPLQHRGIWVELAADDIFRGYIHTVVGVQHWIARLKNSRAPQARAVLEIMETAQEIIEDPDENWVPALDEQLIRRIHDFHFRGFRVDGRMIVSRWAMATKPEGSPYDQLVVRIHRAQPHAIPVDSAVRKVYRCTRPRADRGIREISWDCARLKIEGRSDVLPVFIDRHAINRLEERVPLRGQVSFLHRVMVASLEDPALTPRGNGTYLVDFGDGDFHFGYFVAEVLPDLVLVRTFLFLTMQGTPEAELLREKLGLSRSDVERYKLDHFWTLTASDLAVDPLMSRVLAECGCSHLLSFINPTKRFKWVEEHGARLKERLNIREANGGFMVGQKWIRWSEASEPAGILS
jgi:hypothetical protein